jgi:hypothetical protein
VNGELVIAKLWALRRLRLVAVALLVGAAVVPVSAAYGTTVPTTTASHAVVRAAPLPDAAVPDAAGHKPRLHEEREPDGATGRNDTPAKAERIGGFGTGRHEDARVRIAGTLAPPSGGGSADVDMFSVNLEVGEILVAAVTGASAARLALHGPDGRELLSSRGNAAFYLPPTSPLLRDGQQPVLHHIVSHSGRYSVEVSSGSGRYEASITALRPGPEQDRRGVTQILYLDFDGARIDTTPFQRWFAVPGIRDLSPLAAFLPKWGLTPADETAVIRVADATVRSIFHDVVARGANANAAVQIRTSVTDPDPGDAPNVTRIIVGGTVAEAVFTFPTIGVAESVDPGNFDQEEMGLLLLDLMSGPADDQLSLNHYITPGSNRIQFIGQVLGQLAAHEAGHLYGSFHTDATNTVASLMDGGGGSVADAYGLGPDNIGGTADDVSQRFARDMYRPGEAYTGIEDTVNVTAFGLARGRN